MSEQTQMDGLAPSEPAFAPIEPQPAPEATLERAAEPVTEAARIAIRDLEDGQRVRGVYAVRGRELRRPAGPVPAARTS